MEAISQNVHTFYLSYNSNIDQLQQVENNVYLYFSIFQVYLRLTKESVYLSMPYILLIES